MADTDVTKIKTVLGDDLKDILHRANDEANLKAANDALKDFAPAKSNWDTKKCTATFLKLAQVATIIVEAV